LNLLRILLSCHVLLIEAAIVKIIRVVEEVLGFVVLRNGLLWSAQAIAISKSSSSHRLGQSATMG